MTTYMAQIDLGSWASILGLLVSLIGFVVTFINVGKSKTAAEAAREATHSLKNDISRYHTVTTFTETLSAMTEIKRLHRSKEWHFLPEKCEYCRKSLITIRLENNILTENDKQVIQSAITQFSTLEGTIDKYLQTTATEDVGAIDVSKNNKIVSKQIDKIHELLVKFNSQIGN